MASNLQYNNNPYSLFDPSQYSNPYSQFNNQPMPWPSQVMGWPTDAMGNPIGGGPQAQPPAPAPTPTGQQPQGLNIFSNPQLQALQSQMAWEGGGRTPGTVPYSWLAQGMADPQTLAKTNRSLNGGYVPPGTPAAVLPMMNGGFQGPQTQAQPAPAAQPGQLSRNQYLALLANPGPVTTPGATVPQSSSAPGGPGVLQQFLANWKPAQSGPGSGFQQSFASALKGLGY
jgi:hypothetical protein